MYICGYWGGGGVSITRSSPIYFSPIISPRKICILDMKTRGLSAWQLRCLIVYTTLMMSTCLWYTAKLTPNDLDLTFDHICHIHHIYAQLYSDCTSVQNFKVIRPLFMEISHLQLCDLNWPLKVIKVQRTWGKLRDYIRLPIMCSNKRPLGLTAPLSNCLCYTNDV